MQTMIVKFYSVDISGREVMIRALRMHDTQDNVEKAAYALQEQWMKDNPGKFAYWSLEWTR